MYPLAICVSSFQKCLFRSSAHCSVWLLAFLSLGCMSSLYIFEIRPLLVASFAYIFSHFFVVLFVVFVASLVAQTVKQLPAMQETWVRSLGGEDPLEKETAAHSSILGWKIPQTEETGRLQSMGSKELDTTERCHVHFQTSAQRLTTAKNCSQHQAWRNNERR